MADREAAGREAQLAGDIGEATLMRLTAEAGLNAAKVAPDRTGWDFCLEPLASPQGPILDLAPGAFRWMVQVKAVQGGKTPIPITLENWQRMVKDSLPWFVFVVELQGREVRAGYLVHVGERLIYAALKRLRRASGPRPKLNKKTMSLPWDGGDRLEPLSGASLLALLKKASGREPEAYALKKQHALKTVGYAGVRGRAHLEVEHVNLPALADFLVGVRDAVPLKSLRLEDVRFGIPKDVMARGEGVLRGPPAPSHAVSTVTLSDRDGGLLQALSFDTRHARTIMPGLPEKHDCLALSRPYLSLTIRPSESSLHFRIDVPDIARPQRFADFGQAAEFASHLVRSREEGVKITLSVPGGVPLELSAGDLKEVDVVQRSFVKALADAWWLAQKIGLSPDTAVAPEAVAQRNIDLVVLREAHTLGRISWSGTFVGDPEPLKGPCGAFDIKVVEVADRIYAAALSLVGEVSIAKSDGVTSMSVKHARAVIEKEVVLPRETGRDRLEAILEEWRGQAESILVERGAVMFFMMPKDE